MSNFSRVADFLNNNKIVSFATTGLDGMPRVRPFMFMLAENGKLYFCTGTHKEVYQELLKNPHTQLCVTTAQYDYIRLFAKVNIVKDVPTAQKIIDTHPELQGFYKGGNDPRFVIFYLSECRVEFASLTGPSEKFTLP